MDWSEWNVRGDYDITKSNRATFRWTNDSWDNPSPNNPIPFWGESAFPTVDSSWSQPSRSVLAKLSTTFSSTLVNDVEFGFGQNRIITQLAGHRKRRSFRRSRRHILPCGRLLSSRRMQFFGAWGGFGPYGASSYASFWNIAPYGNHEDLYTIQDNLSKVHGNHLFKAGVLFGTTRRLKITETERIGPHCRTVLSAPRHAPDH